MAQSPKALIEGASGLLSAELPVIPRLAGGLDVRELVRPGTAVMANPSEGAVDLAGRRFDDDPSTETHNKNRIAPPDFVSILDKLRHLRHTAVGRAATMIVMATPLAACGHSHQGNILPGQPPAAIAQKDAGQGGGDHVADRVIIGDAACYEDFATLTAEAQAKCADEFTNFSLEQVARLSPLDQARWAYDYHHKVTNGEDGDRLAWSKMFEAQPTALDLANNWLSSQTQDVIRLAWMMQQPDQKALANDPRTWAAFFGIGTTADSQPIKDAQSFVANVPSGAASLDDYMRQAITANSNLYSAVSSVNVQKEKDGGYTLTFNATHSDGSDKTFRVRFFDYLHLDTENGQSVFRVLTGNDEAVVGFGRPVIGMDVPMNA